MTRQWLDNFKVDYYDVYTIRFTFINCRSLSANINIIKQYILDTNYSFIAMTETWLNQLDTCTIKTLQIMGYRLIQRPRTDCRHCGGIAILLGPDINLITSTDVDCNTNCEIFRTTFTYNTSIIRLLLISRPPNNDYNTFLLTLLNLYMVILHFITL